MSRSAQPQSRVSSKGVALVIVMVMLVAISLLSVATMRTAMTSERVTHNVRVETLAKEAAHAGLRHCERLLEHQDASLIVEPSAATSATQLWAQWSTWHRPHAALQTLTRGSLPLAQCMVERHPLDTRLYVVTARGFSPDYQADATGYASSGAAIWVQATLSLCDASTCPSTPATSSPPTVLLASASGLVAGSLPTAPPTGQRIEHRVWRQLLNPPHP